MNSNMIDKTTQVPDIDIRSCSFEPSIARVLILEQFTGKLAERRAIIEATNLLTSLKPIFASHSQTATQHRLF